MGGALRIEGDPAGAGALKLAGRFGAAGGGIDCAAGEGDAAIHPNDRQAAFAAFPAQLSQDLLRGLQQGEIVDLGLLTGGKLPIGQAGDQNLDRIGAGDRLRQGVYQGFHLRGGGAVGLGIRYGRLFDGGLANKKDNSATIRQRLDSQYDDLVMLAQSFSVAQPSAAATTFVSNLNQLISETVTAFNQRKKGSGPAGEGGGGSSDRPEIE